MHSPVTTHWQRASGWPFLAAFLMACTGPQAKAKSPPQPIERLDSEAAAQLLIHVAKPSYPAIARVNFVQGVVKLEIRVTPEGRVSEAHVIEGQPILAVAALEAVQKWLYRPYIFRGTPAPFNTEVVIKFNLHSHLYRSQLPKDADVYLEKQVRPPEVLAHPPKTSSPSSLMVRVLVGSKGEVVDATPLEAPRASDIELARKSLESWKFRPARWGSIAVPWYITVEVQLHDLNLDQAANAAKH